MSNTKRKKKDTLVFFKISKYGLHYKMLATVHRYDRN